MAGVAETTIRMPYRCPACDRTLYSTSASRPGVSSTLTARLLFLAAGLVTAAIYFVLLIVLRETLATRTRLDNDLVLVHYPPTMLLTAITLPVALIPGLAIGWVAGRMPRVRVVRCWNCHWCQAFAPNAVWASEPAPPGGLIHSTDTGPAIVDDTDSWRECTAWAYGQIRSGRLPEEVTEELIAQGWPRDDVESMAERCRREARERKARGEH
jgi:hypothetical protein